MQTGKHIQCLDLLRVVSLPGTVKQFCECAILLEIWDLGGLLQTNLAIPKDSTIVMPSVGGGGVSAKVVSCQQDEFGFLVEISVHGPGWFPEGYVPPHVLPERAES
jgi:hypothetical protein